jgi:hypothetical protein
MGGQAAVRGLARLPSRWPDTHSGVPVLLGFALNELSRNNLPVIALDNWIDQAMHGPAIRCPPLHHGTAVHAEQAAIAPPAAAGVPCGVASLTDVQMAAGTGRGANEGWYPGNGELAPACASTRGHLIQIGQPYPGAAPARTCGCGR